MQVLSDLIYAGIVQEKIMNNYIKNIFKGDYVL